MASPHDMANHSAAPRSLLADVMARTVLMACQPGDAPPAERAGSIADRLVGEHSHPECVRAIESDADYARLVRMQPVPDSIPHSREQHCLWQTVAHLAARVIDDGCWVVDIAPSVDELREVRLYANADDAVAHLAAVATDWAAPLHERAAREADAADIDLRDSTVDDRHPARQLHRRAELLVAFAELATEHPALAADAGFCVSAPEGLEIAIYRASSLADLPSGARTALVDPDAPAALLA